ncbi:MAG: tetratricopeptide repeat protein, partial [Planctomycetes bacterium]|nr:tetratricopeptide repeat protein [Planctomycetota bacterium]
IAQQGDVDRALKLWEESLEIQEKIGDVKGKAATLHKMAGVIAQQGDVDRALKLWEESLEMKEKIGDVRGKAATLAQMAWAAGTQGDAARQRELNLEAAGALGQVRAWGDLVTVLGNLGASDAPDSVRFLAQAVWLIRHIEAPLEQAIQTSAALQQKLGNDSDAAPLIATFAFFQVQTRGQGHPKKEELQGYAMNMLGACAAARKVPEEKFKEWFEAEGLNDPNRFIPALDAALEALVPEGAWLFDRKQVTSSS